MARENAEWLVSEGLLARTVTIKVRYSDFTTVTRSNTKAPTNDPDQIANRAVALLDKTEAKTRPVRLLGAGVHGLVDPNEIAPDLDEERWLPFD
jgi:nucleotidyltransferase/DNA polymerase involved in DNA repair